MTKILMALALSLSWVGAVHAAEQRFLSPCVDSNVLEKVQEYQLGPYAGAAHPIKWDEVREEKKLSQGTVECSVIGTGVRFLVTPLAQGGYQVTFGHVSSRIEGYQGPVIAVSAILLGLLLPRLRQVVLGGGRLWALAWG